MMPIRHMLPIYAGATVVCMLTLYAVGLRGFDAFGLASAALSTGGLLPDADGMSAYGSAAVKFVFMFFMLVGGTSILWHRMMLTRRFRLAFSQRENIAVLLVCLIVGILAAAVRFDTPEGHQSLPLALEDGLFSAISLITTTGVEPHAGAFAALPISLVTLLIFIGGATFSTSGGIKMYRVGVMGLQSLLELNRLILPHAGAPAPAGAADRLAGDDEGDLALLRHCQRGVRRADRGGGAGHAELRGRLCGDAVGAHQCRPGLRRRLGGLCRLAGMGRAAGLCPDHTGAGDDSRPT